MERRGGEGRERGERERDAIEKKGWELVRGRVYT